MAEMGEHGRAGRRGFGRPEIEVWDTVCGNKGRRATEARNLGLGGLHEGHSLGQTEGLVRYPGRG
jgi:hypothetical protein